MDVDYDQDALDAGLDLVGRTGATKLEVGYLHDDVPAEKAGWYAQAQFHGARVIAEDHTNPVNAVEALARKLMEGGLCTYCGRTITISTHPYPGPCCRWTRNGDKWIRGCEATHGERDRKLVEAGIRKARGPHWRPPGKRRRRR